MSAMRAFPPFDLERLRRMLPCGQQLGARVLVLEECNSTQELLRAEVARLGPDSAGLLVLAESQSQGRGRRARDWWTGPARANLAVSLAIHPPPRPLESLTMHGACALADAIGPEARGRRVALKWPNDLLLNGEKVAGMLAETGFEAGIALLGLGVNLRVTPPAEAAPYQTGSLHPLVDREAFLARWLISLERRLTHARLVGPARLESDCLRLLRAWAPHGVQEARSAKAGPLVQFSVQDGLTWGFEGAEITRPLGWIDRLDALPASDRSF
jgi:BirA family biotin operon repressor/biotin-[acetyl-CoA-carboxylase] ligase